MEVGGGQCSERLSDLFFSRRPADLLKRVDVLPSEKRLLEVESVGPTHSSSFSFLLA
jgi:hypothetical protein